MKVTNIKIKDFQQFKDFDLDLTYPEGHEKAGQPLEKVCFIGQSGTGKTTLLELIYLHIHSSEWLRKKYSGRVYETSVSAEFKDGTGDYKVLWEIWRANHSPTPMVEQKNKDNWEKLDTRAGLIKVEQYFGTLKSTLINFPARLNENVRSDESFDDFFHPNGIKVFDFFDSNIAVIWDYITKKLQAFQMGILQFRYDITTSNTELDSKEIEKKVNEFKERQKSVTNPLDDIADNCLDRILNQFNLRVRRTFNFEEKKDIGFIKIEDFEGKEVPFAFASTGTKQVILTALPLFLTKPENTIILFDEPETSFFPDVQRMIVDFYSSFTKDSQFFYSTHSPIIASSFEPCERIFLYFDEEGKVQYRKGVSPEGDDPNDLLIRDFEMETVLGEEGVKKYDEYLLKQEQFKNEKNEDKKKQVYFQMLDIREAYNF